MIFTFHVSTSSLHPSTGEGKGEWGAGEQRVVWGVSALGSTIAKNVQSRAMEMAKSLEGKLDEEQLNSLGLSSLEERRLRRGGLIAVYSFPTKEREAGTDLCSL